MGLLEGKTALITGGTRGIGKGIVERFISEGAEVAFTYRSSSAKADEIIANLNAGDKLIALQSDASSFSDAEALVKKVLESFSKVDILINNAGITKDNLMLRMGEEQWDDVMQINLKSVFNLTKHMLCLLYTSPSPRDRG